jgi:radical SAM protein with 4Fe4S-binding SPASM domain
MANIIVTNVCNLDCAYCFAGELRQTAQAAHFIPLETFQARLDFLARSGIDAVRLIGGEPSLHPHFPELLALAQSAQKPITIFSHGLLSERVLACLESLPEEQCTVLVNMNATRNAQGVTEAEQKARRAVLIRLGRRAMLGFTIFSPNFSLDFLLPLIAETGCRKSIRLGLAHPSVSAQNAYLHPKQYPLVGQKIARFAEKAAEWGIRLEFDCGFVRCMFSPADFETLQQAGADIGWRCNPVLDVGLDERVYHCFPLTKVQTQLDDGVLAADLRADLLEQTRLHRLAGIYKECSTCPFKQNAECTGGCLANTMKRFRRAEIRLRAPQLTGLELRPSI